MIHRKYLALALLVAVIAAVAARADGPPPWDRAQALENGWIYDDFAGGLKQAKETGKPLMIVLRCPP